MIEIIRKRAQRENITYQQEYRWADDPNAGFSFDCNKDGYIDWSKLSSAGKKNLAMCLEGKDPETGKRIINAGIEKFTSSYVEPAVGRCACGREVELYGFTNTCDCGREYNSAGQQLADRSQWGEETGEHPADIARIP